MSLNKFFLFLFFLTQTCIICSINTFADGFTVVCNNESCGGSTSYACPSPSGITAPACGGGKTFYVCLTYNEQGESLCKSFSESKASGELSWSSLARQAKSIPTYSDNSTGAKTQSQSKSIEEIQNELNRIHGIGTGSNSSSPDMELINKGIALRNEKEAKKNGNTIDEQKAINASIAYENQLQSDLNRKQNEQKQNELEIEKDRQKRFDEAGKDNYSYDANHAVEASADSSNECNYSEKLTGKTGDCGFTRNIVNAAQITNFGSQVAGSVATQIVGSGAQIRAANSQTQSGALRAAASTQDTTAKMQMGVGLVNTALGVTQFVQVYQHKKNSNEIRDGTRNVRPSIKSAEDVGEGTITTDGKTFKKEQNNHGYITANNESSIVQNAITNLDLNSKGQKGELKKITYTKAQADAAKAANNPNIETERNLMIETRKKQVEEKMDNMTHAINYAGARGMEEQNKISKEAQAGGLLSTMTGMQQLLMGYFNKQGADQTKSAADKLEQAEQRAAAQAAAAFTPPRSDALASGDTLGARAPGAITGSGANTSPATDIQANSSPTDTTGTNGFGDSRSPENLTNTPDGAPKAGNFDTSKGGGGVAQGGGGFAPGGNTSVNDQAGKEGPTATAYNDTAGKMESGGGGRGAAYSGGGGGGGGGNPSINPADMLAQLGKLLPGGQEEGAGRKPASIEDYVNKPSGLPTALVPQNESLFDHVSTAYRSQQRKRAVGI